MFNNVKPVCRHYLVTGRVQGVYFRANTRDQAIALGLHGWVQNRADGSVELVACGSPTSLARLATFLETGPPGARVDEVICSENTTEHYPDEFTIRR
ncbi:MAG: acylphosphatase [Gammaproteobacteria bacterium]|nr:acylphosphatase [Gammaproteobacteria bacterium]